MGDQANAPMWSNASENGVVGLGVKGEREGGHRLDTESRSRKRGSERGPCPSENETKTDARSSRLLPRQEWPFATRSGYVEAGLGHADVWLRRERACLAERELELAQAISRRVVRRGVESGAVAKGGGGFVDLNVERKKRGEG